MHKFSELLNKINPNKLFLIDSLGALLSAFMLGFVLVKLAPMFGMPPKTLYLLSFIACVLSIYSFLCFVSRIKNWRPFMKITAIANLVYCCLTLGLVIFLFEGLTVLGVTYFILELIIIVTLAIFELKFAFNISD